MALTISCLQRGFLTYLMLEPKTSGVGGTNYSDQKPFCIIYLSSDIQSNKKVGGGGAPLF